MTSYSWPPLDTGDVDYRYAVFCSEDNTNDGSASDTGLLQSETISSITSITETPATGLTDDGGALTSVSIQGVTYSANTVVSIKFTASAAADYEVDVKVVTSGGRTLTRGFAITVKDL